MIRNREILQNKYFQYFDAKKKHDRANKLLAWPVSTTGHWPKELKYKYRNNMRSVPPKDLTEPKLAKLGNTYKAHRCLKTTLIRSTLNLDFVELRPHYLASLQSYTQNPVKELFGLSPDHKHRH